MSELDGFDYIAFVGSATTVEYTEEELEEIERRPKHPIGFGLSEEEE